MNIDPALVKVVGDLGIPIVTLVVLLLFGGVLIWKGMPWYAGEVRRRDDMIALMQQRMVDVVENNTAAITRLCGSSDDTQETLQRIEGKIDRALERERVR